MSKRAKTRRRAAWASDEDARDLVAGILDETEVQAERERARREAAIEAKRDEVAQRQAASAARRQAQIAERVAAERERQVELARSRTERMEALSVTSAPGVVQEEVPVTAAEPVRQRPEDAGVACSEVVEVSAAVVELAPGRVVWALVAVALVAALGSAAAMGVVVSQQRAALDTASYAKVQYVPKDAAVVMTIEPTVLLPKAAAAAVTVKEEPRRIKRRRRGRPKVIKAKPGFRLNLNVDDPFDVGVR